VLWPKRKNPKTGFFLEEWDSGLKTCSIALNFWFASERFCKPKLTTPTPALSAQYCFEHNSMLAQD
jgi:hypothetical protein